MGTGSRGCALALALCRETGKTSNVCFWVGALASWGCCDKCPQTRGLQATHILISLSWRPQSDTSLTSLKTGVGPGLPPAGTAGGQVWLPHHAQSPGPARTGPLQGKHGLGPSLRGCGGGWRSAPFPPLPLKTVLAAQGCRVEVKVFRQSTETLIKGLQGELDLPKFTPHALHEKPVCSFQSRGCGFRGIPTGA